MAWSSARRSDHAARTHQPDPRQRRHVAGLCRPRGARAGAEVLMRLHIVALVVCLTACSHGSYVWVQDLPPAQASRTIGAGDSLEVQVYGDENMSTKGK